MVKALGENKIKLAYGVYPAQGHGFYCPEDNFDFFGWATRFHDCRGSIKKHSGER